MDMLVRLCNLQFEQPALPEGIVIKRAIGPELHVVTDWVRREFGEGWASECTVAITNQPSTCFVAVENGKILGFACYDATYRDFFGPTGVSEEARNKGIGKALLMRCMEAMYHAGYAYAIIGGAGPKDYYGRCVDAMLIPDSEPGVYFQMLS